MLLGLGLGWLGISLEAYGLSSAAYCIVPDMLNDEARGVGEEAKGPS